jgi:hypothetical protein
MSPRPSYKATPDVHPVRAQPSPQITSKRPGRRHAEPRPLLFCGVERPQNQLGKVARRAYRVQLSPALGPVDGLNARSMTILILRGPASSVTICLSDILRMMRLMGTWCANRRKNACLPHRVRICGQSASGCRISLDSPSESNARL